MDWECLSCGDRFVDSTNYGKMKCLIHPGDIKTIICYNDRSLSYYTCCGHEASLYTTILNNRTHKSIIGCTPIDHISIRDIMPREYKNSSSNAIKASELWLKSHRNNVNNLHELSFQEKLTFLNYFCLLSLPSIIIDKKDAMKRNILILDLERGKIEGILEKSKRPQIRTSIREYEEYREGRSMDTLTFKTNIYQFASKYDKSGYNDVNSSYLNFSEKTIIGELNSIHNNNFFIQKYMKMCQETRTIEDELRDNIGKIWKENPRETKQNISRINNQNQNIIEEYNIIPFVVIKRMAIPINVFNI